MIPYSWSHFCFASNGELYNVVVDGRLWYEGIHTIQSDEMITTNLFFLGTYDENYFRYGNFTGELAELNIWSTFLTAETLMNLTKSCQIPEIVPAILQWAEIDSSMLNTNSTNMKQIKNICFNSEDGGNIFHKVMPIRLVQASAMQVCKTLKAQLSYPLTTEEYQNWPSKLIFLLEIDLEAVDIDFPLGSFNNYVERKGWVGNWINIYVCLH